RRRDSFGWRTGFRTSDCRIEVAAARYCIANITTLTRSGNRQNAPAFPGGVRCRIQRISKAGNRVTDHDYQQRLAACRNPSHCLECLFAPRATFIVPIEHGRRRVDDSVSITESLAGLGDGLRRVRRPLNRLAFEGELRIDKAPGVGAGGRLWTLLGQG